MIACLLAITALPAGAAQAGQDDVPGVELGTLLEQFNGAAPATDGSVHLDAWIEAGPESDELVVVVEPRGQFKLVADPGITITPTPQPGVQWLVPLPHRHVDPEIPYSRRRPPCACRFKRMARCRSRSWSSTPIAWWITSASSARKCCRWRRVRSMLCAGMPASGLDGRLRGSAIKERRQRGLPPRRVE